MVLKWHRKVAGAIGGVFEVLGFGAFFIKDIAHRLWQEIVAILSPAWLTDSMRHWGRNLVLPPVSLSILNGFLLRVEFQVDTCERISSGDISRYGIRPVFRMLPGNLPLVLVCSTRLK